MKELKAKLLTYNNLLTVSRLSNQQLSDLPLPTDLDPSRSTPLPTRFSTLSLLIRDSIACAACLPFYTAPLLIHAPIYFMAQIGASIAKEELETQAQMKIAFGLLFSLLIYPLLGLVLALLFGFTAIGALVGFGSVYAFNVTHATAVDETYERWKRLVAAWRILIGVWRPKGDLAIDKLQALLPKTSAPAGASKDAKAWQSGGPQGGSETKREKHKKVPSRRLVKHVLRTRVEASRLLERYLAILSETDPSVHARPWLAGETDIELDEAGSSGLPKSKRSGREVVDYLKSQGARILPSASKHSEWAAALSGDEGEEETES